MPSIRKKPRRVFPREASESVDLLPGNDGFKDSKPHPCHQGLPIAYRVDQRLRVYPIRRPLQRSWSTGLHGFSLMTAVTIIVEKLPAPLTALQRAEARANRRRLIDGAA